MKENFKSRLICIIFLSAVILTTSSCGSEEPSIQSFPGKILPTVPAATPEPILPSPSPTMIPEEVKKAEAYYEKGFALYNEFKYGEAIKLFDNAIAMDSGSYKAYNGKGIALCFQGFYDEGISLIQKALDLKPDFAYARFNMAMAYKLRKDYPNALLWFDKAIEADPEDTWSYYGISTIYADQADVPKALEYLEKAIALDAAVKEVAKQQEHFRSFKNNPDFTRLVN